MVEVKIITASCLDGIKSVGTRTIDMVLCNMTLGTMYRKEGEVPLLDYVYSNGEIQEWLDFVDDRFVRGDNAVEAVSYFIDNSSKGLVTELERVLKKDGVAAIITDEPYASKIREAAGGFYRYDLQIPVDFFIDGPELKSSRLQKTVIILSKSGVCYNKAPIVRKIKTSEDKLLTLLEQLVRAYTEEGNKVLDICMENNKTGIASVGNKRSYVGVNVRPIVCQNVKEDLDMLLDTVLY